MSPPRRSKRGPGGVVGEEHHRLAGRVAAAHHGGPAVLARSGMDRGAGVEDPRPVPPLAAGDGKPLVGGAGGDQDRPAADDLAVVEDEPVHLVLAGHRADLDRGDQLGPELQGLEVAPIGQVRPGQAGGEPHVVLDPRAGPGLAARPEPVEDDGGQPLGGAVDGRREPGRAGADDHQVERLGADLPLQAEALGQPGDRRPRRPRAPVAGHERQLVGRDAPATPCAARPAGSSASIQVCGTLFLSKNSRISVRSGSPRCPKTRTPTKPGPLQHEPPRLERLQQLVAEVGDLLDHPAQLGLADAVGPDRPPRRRPRSRRGGRSEARRRQ